MTIYVNFSELPSWLMLASLKRLCSEVRVELAWKPMLSSLGNVAGSNLKPGVDDPLEIYKAREPMLGIKPLSAKTKGCVKGLESTRRKGKRK